MSAPDTPRVSCPPQHDGKEVVFRLVEIEAVKGDAAVGDAAPKQGEPP